MKNLSNDELIYNIATLYHQGIEGSIDAKIFFQIYKVELLCCLESGDKVKQMCKEIVELYDKHFEA